MSRRANCLKATHEHQPSINSPRCCRKFSCWRCCRSSSSSMRWWATTASATWPICCRLLTLAGAAFLTVRDFSTMPVLTMNGLFIDDPLSDVLKLFLYLTVAVVLVYSRDYLRERGPLQGRVLRAGAVCHAGHDGDGLRQPFPHAVSRSRTAVAVPVCDGRAAARFQRGDRSRDEIFRTGRAGIRHAALRHVHGVRRDRLAGAGRHRAWRCTTAPTCSIPLVFGIVFIVAGLAFKLGAVPFHMWVPDVYHGAPTAMTLFIGSAPKLAAFAFVVRILGQGLESQVGRVARHAGDPGRAVHGRRQYRRHRANQPEAHAGVFHHLAHGLHAARHSGGFAERLQQRHVLRAWSMR